MVTTLAGFYGSLGCGRWRGTIGALFLSLCGRGRSERQRLRRRPHQPRDSQDDSRQALSRRSQVSRTRSDSLDGTGSAARFSAPQGVAVDSAGTVYVADTNNHTIRTITPGRRRDHARGTRVREWGHRRDRQCRAIQWARGLRSTAPARSMSPIPAITRSGKSHPAAS